MVPEAETGKQSLIAELKLAMTTTTTMKRARTGRDETGRDGARRIGAGRDGVGESRSWSE